MAYFKNTKNVFTAKSKGFRPRHPAKIPSRTENPVVKEAPENREETLSQVILEDRRICAELEAAIEVAEIMRAIPDKVKDSAHLLKLLEARDSYLDLVDISPQKKVHNLMLSERPKGKNLLQGLTQEFKERLMRISSVKEADRFQDKLQAKYGFSTMEAAYVKPISREMRRIIRAEFNGGINQPDSDNLSADYAELIKDNPVGMGIYKDNDYDLSSSETWKMMAQFPNFAKLQGDIQQALAFNNVPPEMTGKLNFYDFEDLIFRHHSEGIGDAGLNFVRLFEGSKEFAVKLYSRNHGEELSEGFKKLGAEGADIEQTLEMMQKRGKIPALPLSGGRVLKATVHHETSIMDAALKENPIMVNNADNMKIIFEVFDPSQAENVQELSGSRQTDFVLEKKIRAEKIQLKETVDLTQLATDPKGKADFIKTLALNYTEELLRSMKNIGLPFKDIEASMVEMAREGKMTPVPIKEGKVLGLSLKENRCGVSAVFGLQEIDNDRADIHRGIFHGNSTRPVAEEEHQKNEAIRLVSAELDDSEDKLRHEKEAYAIENSARNGSVKKYVRRLVSRLKKNDNGEESRSVFYLGSINRVIYSDSRDKAGQERRYQRPVYRIERTSHGHQV